MFITIALAILYSIVGIYHAVKIYNEYANNITVAMNFRQRLFLAGLAFFLWFPFLIIYRLICLYVKL